MPHELLSNLDRNTGTCQGRAEGVPQIVKAAPVQTRLFCVSPEFLTYPRCG